MEYLKTSEKQKESCLREIKELKDANSLAEKIENELIQVQGFFLRSHILVIHEKINFSYRKKTSPPKETIKMRLKN